jgi:putative hemin transport protein
MKDLETLRQELETLKKNQPKVRNRDLARQLGISEAELLTLSLGEDVVRLEGDWKELLRQVKDWGYVMALTRNEHCVHERKGIYDNITFYEGAHNVGVAVNPDIDLRFFMNEWTYGLAVTMHRGKLPTLYSFQFFNAEGEAVHKIFSTPKSQEEAYWKLRAEFRAAEQAPITDVVPVSEERPADLPDDEIDQVGFQAAWRNLQDTHNFYGMLKDFEVSRTQGLRLAPYGFTRQVDNGAVIRTLQLASQRQVPIMCFLHSKGCVQIHTGPVRNLKQLGDWYNVLDPTFNLHLRLDRIAQSWIVKKPTADGIVTSLELFDSDGQLIVYFFGARKPGIPELGAWRKIVSDMQLPAPKPVPEPES